MKNKKQSIPINIEIIQGDNYGDFNVSLPVGDGSLPAGDGSLPVGDGSLPVGDGSLPVGNGSLPDFANRPTAGKTTGKPEIQVSSRLLASLLSKIWDILQGVLWAGFARVPSRQFSVSAFEDGHRECEDE